MSRWRNKVELVQQIPEPFFRAKPEFLKNMAQFMLYLCFCHSISRIPPVTMMKQVEENPVSPPFSPPQTQSKQPGEQSEMFPQPLTIRESYKGSEKLIGKVALISGGDSGIGRAVAVHFAREKADVAIIYLEEDKDAEETRRQVEKEGQYCLLIRGNAAYKDFCEEAVQATLEKFQQLDVLVNNIAQQYPQKDLMAISTEQLELVFRTNVFSYFFLTQAALPYLREHSAVINSGSITSFRGSERLVDYSATKGAIQALTYSLAQQLADRKIRVNGVAPGPVWTPLIPSSFTAEEVAKFGKDTLLKRPAQPAEIAPAYVYLASEDASYITGQFIHINGGAYNA